MGAYDQGARFATQADPNAVVRRMLLSTGLSLSFRAWQDTRTIPMPGGPDRIADLVAALDSQEGLPSLLILEFQSEHDPEKLDVLLEEVAILRCRVRHGEDRKGKYRVLPGLIYLKDRCPETVLDMTLPGGFGIRHAPLIWNVGEDNATTTLEDVAGGRESWGILFWIALMAGGDDDVVIARWKDVVTQVVQDRRMRGNLAGVALVFAELVSRRIQWKRGLEGFDMTESEVVNEWISQGVTKGELKTQRQNLLELLEVQFPGAVPNDVVQLIQKQESLELLHDWFRTALRVDTFEQFMDVLKR